MKIWLLVASLVASRFHTLCGLVLSTSRRKATDADRTALQPSGLPSLRHHKTSRGNESRLPAVELNKQDAYEGASELMQSTPHGICMYDLPAQFNVGLVDSTFKQPVPVPRDISPPDDPPLSGMFDTIQFSLERIFYDRMNKAATFTRPARECVMFYVPYFVAWETSAVHQTWLNPYRPHLDAELFTRLKHYNASGVPGRHHFIVLGRVSFGVWHFLQDPKFKNMLKLVLEDTGPGLLTNVFAVPYPTWFRYHPELEPVGPQSILSVHWASLSVQKAPGCNPTWLGNLTLRMKTACNNREFCAFHISPELDEWVVGGNYEGMDANGHWWPITIADKNENGTFSVDVHDGHGSKWPKVFKTHMRRSGQVASAEAHALTTRCPIQDVTGQYSCSGGAPLTFKTVPQESAAGHAVVLGCRRGPCWLWGTCHHRGLAPGLLSRPGPLVAIIGSAREKEHERKTIFRMCQDRPNLCSVFYTGHRENSTSFIHNHIADMYQLIMATTFCISPPGDTPTRKGLFDALVLGCIPVVTSEDSLQHYSFHLPFWRSVSVLVTSDKIFSTGFNLIDYLADYELKNPEAVRQKQEAIRLNAYALQYSDAPASTTMRGPDAFDKTLEHLLARPHSPQWSFDFTGIYSIVNLATGRRLFARPGVNEAGIGASNVTKIDAFMKWRILGKGDGTCCYAFSNVGSSRLLHSNFDAMGTSRIGARPEAEGWKGNIRWRLVPQDPGEVYVIANVGSGKRIYAGPGQEHVNFGVGLAAPLGMGETWQLVKVQ
jgi:hypothetical protein